MAGGVAMEVMAVGITADADVTKTESQEAKVNDRRPGDAFLNRVTVSMSNVARGHVYIPKGTTIPLELVDPIGSKKSKTGNTFRLKVQENLLINDVVVIAKGTEVVGQITNARKNGLFGRKGRLEFVIPHVETVNGIEVPVHGTVEGKGKSDGGAVAVAALATVVGGLFMKGTNVYYEPGQIFEVTVADDTDIGATPENLAEVMDPNRSHGKNIQIVIR